MTPLLNPEALWTASESVTVISQSEVEKCIGPTSETLQFLSGGRIHRHIRVGNEKVLRLYEKEAPGIGKEKCLLQRAWKNLIVPTVIGSGSTYLLMKYVDHSPLEDKSEVGTALGKALGEIHSFSYSTSGFLDSDLNIEEKMDDFVTDMWSYLCSFMDMPTRSSLSSSLLDEVIAFFDHKIEDLQKVAGPSVLLHGEFEVSNLFWSPQSKPLVLDWEYAYAGSALMDIGQLFRWGTSPAFENAFVQSYTTSGGRLADNWKEYSGILDLINLVGLLYKSVVDSRRYLDLTSKIKTILQAGEGPRNV